MSKRNNSSSSRNTSNAPMFRYLVIKMNEYKNRLTIAYYGITLWDFKSSKRSKNLTSVKSKKEIFKNVSKYQNTVYYDFKSRLIAIFSSNYWHRLVLKIPFPNHIFSKILKYRTESPYFLSTDKYYVQDPPLYIIMFLENGCKFQNSQEN